MFGEDYAYAVARIRVLETGLLNQAAIEQLLACQDEQQCLQILTEKGWGNGDPAAGADAILSREREKIWEIMDSLVADRSVFSVLWLLWHFAAASGRGYRNRHPHTRTSAGWRFVCGYRDIACRLAP